MIVMKSNDVMYTGACHTLRDTCWRDMMVTMKIPLQLPLPAILQLIGTVVSVFITAHILEESLEVLSGMSGWKNTDLFVGLSVIQHDISAEYVVLMDLHGIIKYMVSF